MPTEITEYQNTMEPEWVLLRARIAARSHTWDFVERHKVKYENPSIELVLKKEGQLIGYIDAEIETEPGQICWEKSSRGAVVQEFGIAPEFHKQGLAKKLLQELAQKLQAKDINRIEFWTKDPESVKFYRHLNYKEIFCHQHVRISADEIAILKSQNKWQPIYAYMIKANNTKIISSIQEAPLEPHTCYGFEWQP